MWDEVYEDQSPDQVGPLRWRVVVPSPTGGTTEAITRGARSQARCIPTAQMSPSTKLFASDASTSTPGASVVI